MSDPNAYYARGLGVEMYDLFTGGGLLDGDIAFYQEQARRFGGPILELACGTGRILSPLVAAGHDVVGLDRSRAMLDMAAAKPGLGAVLHEGDMRDFRIDRSFALIIVAARSFQHLVEPAEQRAALSCARRHLRPDGHLILDLFDPKFELLFDPAPSAAPAREACHPITGRLVRRSIVARETDKLRQTVKETRASRNWMRPARCARARRRRGRCAGACARKCSISSSSAALRRLPSFRISKVRHRPMAGSSFGSRVRSDAHPRRYYQSRKSLALAIRTAVANAGMHGLGFAEMAFGR